MIIKKHAATAAKDITLKELTGQRIAVDGNLCLYQFLSAVRLGSGGGPLVNRNGEITRYINNILL